MQFPLPENRIANYGKISSYLSSVTCQKCHSLSLQQVICYKCHENICFKCITQSDDQIPEPYDKPIQNIQFTKNTKYMSDQNYRGMCPVCEMTTVMTSQLPKIFHRLYTNVKFMCINRIDGCPEELCYPDLRIHESKCGFNQIQCPNQECGQTTLRKDYQNHMNICSPITECVCGATFRESKEHNEQTCLKYQCETLKSQLMNPSLSFSSPQKPQRNSVQSFGASPFSLQALLQQASQY